MKNKSSIKLIIIIFLLLTAVLLYYYFVLKNSKVDVSGKRIYSSILNKDLISVNEAILIVNSTTHFTKEYDFELQDAVTIDTARVEYKVVPIGSVFHFKKVLHIKSGVSGNEFAYLLGEVQMNNIKQNVIYQWGDLKTLCIEEPCNYWLYKKAPWQQELDTQKCFH